MAKRKRTKNTDNTMTKRIKDRQCNVQMKRQTIQWPKGK